MVNEDSLLLPNVAIVIPECNATLTIAQCIEACLAQKYGGYIEVIIVDDGSKDRTAEVVPQYPSVKLITQSNSGPSRARNRGWKASNCQIIFFTDSDCVPNPLWVANNIQQYTSDKVAGVGGSYSILNPDSFFARCIHEEICYRHRKMPRKATFLGSYNVSFRREILEKVGGFEETYKMASGEDNDLSYKIIRLGYELIFDPNNNVGHYHPSQIWKYFKRQECHGYWRMKLYRDHPWMVKGDGYSNMLDFLQPPLFTIIFLLLPLFWLPGVFQLIGMLSGVAIL